MSNAKLGSSYDDKFSGMELGKLRATVAEQDDEIERLEAKVAKLEAALAALLEDTQHSEHICPDDDCPVRLAKAALKESDDG
jgi:hypothetical protein